MKAEFSQKRNPSDDDLNWVNAIKNGVSKLEDIIDESRRNYIKGLL